MADRILVDLTKIDPVLFREQRHSLIDIRNYVKVEADHIGCTYNSPRGLLEKTLKKRLEDLDGLIELTDHIADQLADNYGMKEVLLTQGDEDE